MSTLFLEQSVEVVKLVLNKRDGSGTVTYYIGQEYFAEDAIYSGSPEVFPVLSSSVPLNRTMGMNVMELPGMTIDIFGKMDFDRKGRGFADLAEEYDFHNIAVTFLYYAKGVDGTTTHSDSVNIRGTATVINSSFSPDGGLTLSCQDQYFKDKSFAKYFKSSDFDALVDEWNGELRPTVFGRYSSSLGVVMPGALIYHTQTDGSGYRTRARWFTGNAWSDYPMNDLVSFYVKSQSLVNDPTEFHEVEIVADPDVSVVGDSPTSAKSLFVNQHWGLNYTPSTAQIITHCKADMDCNSSLADGDGEVQCIIYEGQSSGTAVKDLRKLATATFKNSSIPVGSVSTLTAVFDNPVVMSPNVFYLIALEWQNTNASPTAFPRIYTANSGGSGIWSKSYTYAQPDWVKISSWKLALRLYALGFSTPGFEDYASGAGGHSYYQVQTTNPSAIHSTLQASDLRALETKLSVNGIEDDSSGTYTGSASSLIYNPADLIRYLAADSKYGAVTTSNIDSTTFDATRSALSSVSVGALIDSPMTVEELIFKLCREFRLRIYKTRAGKIALVFPTPIASTPDVTITQAALHGDMRILSIATQPYSSVINDALIDYSPDYLYTPRDTAHNTKKKKLKHRNAVYVNKDESGTSDAERKRLCGASDSLYGARIFRETWEYIHEESSANDVMEYYINRYSTVQQRCIVRVPRKDYYSSIDLLSTIRLEHQDIQIGAGSADSLTEFYAGDEVTPTYEGVKIASWAGGNLKGEVVRVVEVGNYLELTLETVSDFEGS